MKTTTYCLPLLLAALTLTAPLYMTSCSPEGGAASKAGNGFIAVGTVSLSRPLQLQSLSTEQTSATFPDPSLEQEKDALVSAENLRIVAEAAHLDTRWQCSPDEAAKILAQIVYIMPIQGTDMVEISVRCGDGAVAADIFQCLLDAYNARCIRRERAILEDSLAKHRSVLERLKQDLADCQEQLDAGNESARAGYTRAQEACEQMEKNIAREEYALQILPDVKFAVLYGEVDVHKIKRPLSH